MDPALAVETAALAGQKAMNDAIARGNSPVQQFYNGTTVFVTGGSGFLGKQLIEKLFRTCNIKKIYMLLRSKKGKTIKERLAQVLNDPLLLTLRSNQPDLEDKLVPIEGDVAELGLGIKDTDKLLLTQEVEVIFHVAATISFDEPLRSATMINLRGTRKTISLARMCTRLKSLVHVSTAYSHATAARADTPILEQFYPCHISPELMIQLAEGLEETRLNSIKESLIAGWPNTYLFTKSLTEELIRTSAADLPLCIIRPTIVICTRRGPCPGWVDISSVYGPSGIILGITMGVIHVLHGRQQIKTDFVPVDYVCNAAIVAATTAKEQPLKIYQIGSSCRNHVTWADVTNILEGGRNTVVSDRAIWYGYAIQSSNRWCYLVLKSLLHYIPAYIVDGLCAVLRKPQRLKKIYSTIDKIDGVLTFFMNNEWIFDDQNTLKLHQQLSEQDKIIYHHDIADVGWRDMIILWCVGLRKYIVKDGLTNTELGVKRQMYFKSLMYVFLGLGVSSVWTIFAYFFTKSMVLPFSRFDHIIIFSVIKWYRYIKGTCIS